MTTHLDNIDVRFEKNTNTYRIIRRNSSMPDNKKYNLKKIKNELLMDYVFSINETRRNLTSILSKICSLYPEFKWSKSEIKSEIIDSGFFVFDDNENLYQIKELVENSKGRFFGISWVTSAGNIRKASAKFHSNYGLYSRIITGGPKVTIKTFDPRGLIEMSIDGKVLKGKKAA